MATEFKLPELGENIKTIQVVKVLVDVGDTLVVDQPVLELETDKATVEVPSTVAGTVADIFVQPGSEITVGHTILTLVQPTEAAPAAPTPAPAAKPAAKPKAAPADAPAPEPAAAPAAAAPAPAAATAGEFMLPSLGENIKTIQVVKVLVKVGDVVARDQPVVELETDKATVEVPSEVAGTVTELLVAAGDEIGVGHVLFRYAGAAPARAPVAAPAAAPQAPAPAAVSAVPAAGPATPVVAPVAATAPASVPPPPPGGRVPAAPSVRRFAREIGLDVNQVPGSGPAGRVSLEDVKRHAKQLNQSRAAAPVATSVMQGAGGVQEEPLPDFSRFGEVTREKMSVIRRKTAEHMARSWALVPHVTIFDAADITEIEALRKRYTERAEKAGGKLTLAVMMVKIVAQALKVFPKFNASIDMTSRELVYKKFYNVGVAVDTERGLMVPVLREADRKNMIQISVEMTQIAEKARTGKITVAELEGGTFTISNLGRSCGTFFTPIVNHPEVAILGVGRAYEESDPRGGGVRRKLPLSLSFDHRAIDGADAVRFLGWIIEALGEPLVLSLEG